MREVLDVYRELEESDELTDVLEAIADIDSTKALLERYGCDATDKQARSFMTAVTAAQPYADELDGELPESMLGMVNGGVACLMTTCPRCHMPTLAFYARDGWECTNCHYQEA